MSRDNRQRIAAYTLDPGTFPLNRVSKTDYVQLAELAQAEVEKLRKQGGWDAE